MKVPFVPCDYNFPKIFPNIQIITGIMASQELPVRVKWQPGKDHRNDFLWSFRRALQ